MKKIILSTLAAATLIQAAPLGITTETKLGYIKNTGNTETETFSLDMDVKKEWEKHVAAVKITAQDSEESDIKTNRSFLIEAQYDYKFTETFAFNYLVGYKYDSFSSYEYQFYTGPGAKYMAIKSDTQNLEFSTNILYAQDRFMDTHEYTDVDGNIVVDPYPYVNGGVRTAVGQTVDYPAYRLALIYDVQMLENLKFTQELNYRGDFDDSENYFVYSKTGLSTKLSDYLSAGISYTMDYVNKPDTAIDPDITNTDGTFTVNLIINY